METNKDYGFDGKLDSVRALYNNLPVAYLDNAAAPLFMRSIAYAAADLLVNSSPVASPHSNGPLSSRTTSIVDETRAEILKLLNVSPLSHEIIFCSNATAAAKLIGEAIHTSHFSYSIDSHTSIVGLRDLAKSWSTFTDDKELKYEANSVISWPLQSNFNGKRYPGIEWVGKVHDHGGLVLLDIASFAATEMPDLKAIEADFCILSFYKIFGLPDLGALVVRKTPRTVEFLNHKRYFGGGTVAALAPSAPWMARPKDNDSLATWLEDGTLPVHTIITLKAAMSEFKQVFGEDYMARISRHTKALARYCRTKLSKIDDCIIYDGPGEYGPIVTFGLNSIGHNEFSAAAALKDVHVRAGTLCNIGAFTLTSQTSDKSIIANFENLGKRCNDQISFIDGQPTGVIRVSFGPYNSAEDVDALVGVIDSMKPQSLPEERASRITTSSNSKNMPITIQGLYVYPIKSCSGLSVTNSLLTESGLEYDRLFCLVDLTSKRVLSLKQHRSMIFLKPYIDKDSLIVSFEPTERESSIGSYESIQILLDPTSWKSSLKHDQLLLNLDANVIDFFSQSLGTNCTIARSLKQDSQANNAKAKSFANSSPLLVVSVESGAAIGLQELSVFRPNIVIKSSNPWEEDHWARMLPWGKNKNFEIILQGKCRRCNMICVTSSGVTESFPYLQLCKYRKDDGKIYFGQHASFYNLTGNEYISVGDLFIGRTENL